MAIEKDALIEISQVGNGFIVRHGGPWFERDTQPRVWIGASSDYLVFRTMAELQAWLSDHFTHRSSETWADEAQKLAA